MARVVSYELRQVSRRVSSLVEMYGQEYSDILDRIRRGERVTAREIFTLVAREHSQILETLAAYRR